METKDQVEFIRYHGNAVLDRLCNEAAHGKLPETWEGLELKQYLMDSFSIPKNWLNGKRRKDYNNELLIRNL